MFTEDVIEKMIIDSLVRNGWEYIPAEELPRNYTDVMVEPMVRDALIRLNPAIAANPSYADEVIIKLRPLFMQARATDLVTLNEEFKAALTELFNSVKNSSTPIIVERIVNEIDEIVKIVRFPGWKDTIQGRNDVIKALKSVFIKKRLFDNELFDKAYSYVEQYY